MRKINISGVNFYLTDETAAKVEAWLAAERRMAGWKWYEYYSYYPEEWGDHGETMATYCEAVDAYDKAREALLS